MNTRKLALLSTVLIGLGGVAAAQQATDPAQEPLQEGQAETLQQQPGQETLPGEMRSRSVTTYGEPYGEMVFGSLQADEVIGMNVVDAHGDSVGSVSDLLIAEDNQVDRAIIDVGGFLGFGAKPVAVDIDRLTIAEAEGEVILDVTREELDAMPEWQAADDGWFTD